MIADDNPKIRLLTEALRTPWLSINQLALRAELEPATVATLCSDFAERGLLTSADQTLPGYPHLRYGPTPRAVHALAEIKSLAPDQIIKVCGLTPERYWTLRMTMETAQETMAMLSATYNAIHNTRDLTGYPAHRFGIDAADFDIFIERHFKGQSIFIHGKLLLYTCEQVRPYWLLVDRGEASVWQWYPQLKVMDQVARRTYCPPLLIVSTHPQRVRAMLVLARTTGGHVPVFATAEHDIALRHGLLNLKWCVLSSEGQLGEATPFTLAGLDRTAFSKSGLAIVTLDELSAVKRRKQPSGSAIAWPCPTDQSALQRFERLSAKTYQVLKFLAHHPACPAPVFATFCDLTEADLAMILDDLRVQGFAQMLTSSAPEPLWAASDIAIDLQIQREMQSAQIARRYRFFCADHARRDMHTLVVYRFFEALKQACQARSRSTRKLDTLPGTLNDGVIPYYELAAFESEFVAAEWYIRGGETRHWRPDGYGAVRAGESVTRFWLEIDGTTLAPSRCDAGVWRDKLSHLCDYLQSRRWTLRYQTQPHLLVVTTDINNRPLLVDAVHAIARGRGITPPQVYLATSQAVAQRGALGKIWYDVTGMGNELGYAFANAQPIAVHGRDQRMGSG